MICPACGVENPSGARFCNACGAALPTEAARQVRKVVTVLFCDVTGSTALGERLDPEKLRGVMSEYFAVARAAIERHGGTVEKFIGDAVMAVFGVPTVREDDALRAVRAALELRDGASLDVRIGVNTGEVVTGTGETLVTGDAVNVAARLEQAAGPGEVLLGESTYRLVRDAVEAGLVPPIEAKGKSEPLTAYRLGSLTGGAGYERRTDASLVGRERERRLLQDAWDRCRSEIACVQFTVLGSAGVGKSRLVTEFLAGLDARVVTGRCLSYGEGITYWPVVEAVKQLLGAEPAPNAAIASLLGEGDAAADDIASAVRRLLEGAARARPLVVVFDDLQWAESTFLELIEHVTDWSRDAPLLVLCLARPDLLDLRPGWGGGKLNATTVLLGPLTEAETDELIERLLGSAELGDGLRERIQKAAEGNPLFVEQMLAMVQDSQGGEVTVPPTIQALLAARLDQLPNGERLALERGAVEGQVFHRGAVQALAPDEPSIPAQLMGLVRKELLRPATATLPEDDAFRFRHLLIRDAAYDALPKATRAELHERFARWLEEHGAGLVELDEVLGYHLEQTARYRAELGDEPGELAVRAGVHLTAAGTRAVNRGDFAAGKRLLVRAVDLLEAGSSERGAALPSLGIALYSLGEFAESDRVLTEAVDSAEPEDAAIAFFVRSFGRGHNPVDGETLESLAQGVRARLAELGETSPLAYAEGYSALGRFAFWQGQTTEQLEAATLGRDYARQAGVTVLEGVCAGMIGSALLYGESSWDAYEAFARGLLDERDRLGRIVDNALSGLAVAASAQGHADESKRLFAQYADALLERGDEYNARTQGQNRGYGLYLAGELEAAENVYRKSWDALGEVGERGFRSTLGGLLALALVELDRRDEAEAILAEVDGLSAEDDWLTVACADLVRARLATLDGRHGDAVAAARRATDLGDEGYFLLRPWFTTELGRALAAAGRGEEARDVLAEAIRVARVKGSQLYVRRAQDVLDTLG
ncbi:MAG TPA: AAA family ATPase [Gaiellaceae bacterium]|nr:AAA family ATPase [Gaiellaceae bacterium]